MILRNTVDLCTDPGPRLDTARIRWIVLHRISLARETVANPHPVGDLDLDGPALAGRFRNTGLGTGGRCPYHFLVRRGGDIDQMLSLSQRGAHDKNYNGRSVAIACAGDMREDALTGLQHAALVELLTRLVTGLGGPAIVGHTALPGASADPGKVCPGKRLAVLSLAAVVTKALPDDWRTNEDAKIDALDGFVL